MPGRAPICRGMIRTGFLGGLGAAVLLAGLTSLPGEARAQERRFFQVAPGPRLDTSSAARTETMVVMDRATIARWLCPNGGTPMRGRPGRCDGRGVGRGGGGGNAASEVAGWHADLPPPTHRQVACPVGTVAAQARLNPGTVRCVPSTDEVRETAARPAAPASPTPVAETAEAREPATPPPAPRAEATPRQAAAQASGS